MSKKKKKRVIERNMPKGEEHPMSKVSDDDVIKIRRLYKAGKYTQAELAKKYKLSTQYICRLINKQVRP